MEGAGGETDAADVQCWVEVVHGAGEAHDAWDVNKTGEMRNKSKGNVRGRRCRGRRFGKDGGIKEGDGDDVGRLDTPF